MVSPQGPNKLIWYHLKAILKQDACLVHITNIVDVCINLEYWPNYFKWSSTVIIPKPNKLAYDNPKYFQPIVFLNTLGKLIEKVITDRLQFHVVKNDFIHPSQLGSLKFKSTSDAGVALTHVIQLGWVKDRTTSILAFDIVQFFPSLNHHLLILSLKKVGLDSKVTSFFMDFLVQRKTNYLWNEFSFPTHEVNMGVGQEFALLPILSTFYLSPFLYILEKCLKTLNIPVSLISFVDDGLFISQNKSMDISNSQLFCSYNVLSGFLKKFGLSIKHSKTETFHFNRSHEMFNPPLLDLLPLEGPILRPKSSWKYLGFIFNWKLAFHQHIDFYLNKAISMVKYMKFLGNLTWGISPIQKCLLYKCCVFPIVLYGFQLWFYNKAPLSYPLKILEKMQRRAAIWILGAFRTSPIKELKAIAGLIPIKLYLYKLASRSYLYSAALLENHLIKTFINNSPNTYIKSFPHSTNTLTDRQKNSVKGHLIDSYNKLHGVFPSFSPLDPELNLGSRIIDIFQDWFSFNLASKTKNDLVCSQQLDDITILSSMSPHTAIVVPDTSIKNDIATLVSYIHIRDNSLIKTVHYAAYVTSTEAELFTIRYGLSQACNKENISKVIVITNSIYVAKKIFNTKLHPYQIHMTAILNEL